MKMRGERWMLWFGALREGDFCLGLAHEMQLKHSKRYQQHRKYLYFNIYIYNIFIQYIFV